MINLTNHSWLQSCKAFSIKDGILSAYLYDTRGNLIYDEIQLDSIKDRLINNHGYFKNITCKENLQIDYQVIHMRTKEERYKNILMNQEKLNKHINIFDAIVVTDINNLQRFDSQLKNNFNHFFINELGCYLSHFMLVKQITSDTGYTVVFEDDFSIVDDLDNKLRNIIDIVDDFDMLCLGNLCNNHGVHYKENIYLPDLHDSLYGTHGYLINNKSARKIYNNLLSIELAIDNQYKMLFDNKQLNVFVIYPNLVEQLPFESTIR